jgi:serine/threonine-protein kinase
LAVRITQESFSVTDDGKSVSALAFDPQDSDLRHQPADMQRVGKYRIVSELGRGGAASVYLAFARGQSSVNKLVVLKALHPDGAADAETHLRFLDEARIAAQLNHANVVQTYEVGMEGERTVIVMEYLEGHTLNQVIRRSKSKGEELPLGMHLHAIIHALEGIHYAHDFRSYDGSPLELVHRDVSPQNIFLTYDGQVKVLDFGIAKVVGATAKTQVGTIKGKIAYMAPEQMRGDAIDRRADVFSIGCMLWAIATGSKLWKDQTDVQIIRSVLRNEIPTVESVNPNCDPEFAVIVGKAMAPDPADRHATALELQSDLQNYCASHRLSASPKELGAYVSRVFSGIRSEMKAQVEREISRILAEDSSNVIYAAAVSALSPPAVPVAPASASRLSSIGKYLAAAAVLGLAMAGSVYWLGDKAPPAAAPVADALAAVAPAPKVEGTTAPAPVGPDKAGVQINFRVSPPGASITVDGRPLPLGTTSQVFPSDDGVHVLKVESSGFPPVVREFSLNRDDTLEVHLAQRAAPARAVTRSTSPPPKPTSVHVAPSSTPKPSEAPSKPECDSPSYFDANGIKRFRAECL